MTLVDPMAAKALDQLRALPELGTGLTVKECREGRGIFATEELSVGREMLKCQPFSYAIDDDQYTSACSYCVSKHKSLQTCGRCHFNHYCNEDCQKSDWSIHKWECLGMKAIHPTVPLVLTRHVLRLLCKAKSCSSKSDLSFTSLCSNTISPEKMFKYKVIKLQLEVMAARVQCIDIGDWNIAKLLSQLEGNMLRIHDNDLQSIGGGFYIIPSLLNHSCIPNCALDYEGKTLSLRVISPISSGQQLYIQYVSRLLPLEGRQSYLMEKYSFRCSCPRCSGLVKTDDLLMVKCSSTKLARLKEDIFDVQTLMTLGDYERALSKCQIVLSKASSLVGDCHEMQFILTDIKKKAAIMLKKWRLALESQQQLTEKFRLVSGVPFSDMVTVNAMKALELAMELFDEGNLTAEDCIVIAKEAIQHLTVTHGTSHKLTKEAGMYLYRVIVTHFRRR